MPKKSSAARQVVESRPVGGGVVMVLEHVRCGRGCNGCPHGPYWYARARNGKRVVSVYVGKEPDIEKARAALQKRGVPLRESA